MYLFSDNPKKVQHFDCIDIQILKLLWIGVVLTEGFEELTSSERVPICYLRGPRHCYQRIPIVVVRH